MGASLSTGSGAGAMAGAAPFGPGTTLGGAKSFILVPAGAYSPLQQHQEASCLHLRLGPPVANATLSFDPKRHAASVSAKGWLYNSGRPYAEIRDKPYAGLKVGMSGQVACDQLTGNLEHVTLAYETHLHAQYECSVSDRGAAVCRASLDVPLISWREIRSHRNPAVLTRIWDPTRGRLGLTLEAARLDKKGRDVVVLGVNLRERERMHPLQQFAQLVVSGRSPPSVTTELFVRAQLSIFALRAGFDPITMAASASVGFSL